MITFAFLGNTLFLTILVSMLSNTFATIVANATAEIQFRKAVQTLEGVKSDAIFAYQPPFNILALFVLLPMKFVVSPRWFHKIHVATVRFVNLPVLLIIAVAERRILSSSGPPTPHMGPRRPWFWEKWKITTHGDLHTVFATTPPDSMIDDIAADDELTHHMIRRQFLKHNPSSASESSTRGRTNNTADNTDERPPGFKPPSRRDSMAPYGDELTEQVRNIISDIEGRKEGDVSDRLDSLEESMRRIEDMLANICGDEERSLEEDGVKAGHMSGTLRDLDRADFQEE